MQDFLNSRTYTYSVVALLGSFLLVALLVPFTIFVQGYASYTSRTGRVLRAIASYSEDILDSFFSERLQGCWEFLDYAWRLFILVSVVIQVHTVFPNLTYVQGKTILAVAVVVWFLTSSTTLAAGRKQAAKQKQADDKQAAKQARAVELALAGSRLGR